MEMDMQEPGDMCCFNGEEHNLVLSQRKLKWLSGPHALANRIIISCLSNSHTS